MSTDWI